MFVLNLEYFISNKVPCKSFSRARKFQHIYKKSTLLVSLPHSLLTSHSTHFLIACLTPTLFTVPASALGLIDWLVPSDVLRSRPRSYGRAVMWLGARWWLPVLVQGCFNLRSLSFARTWGGLRGPMEETRSTGAEAASGVRPPAQQNGDAGGDAKGERPPVCPRLAGQGVELAPRDGEQATGNEELATGATLSPGKRKKRRGTTRERVVPPPKKRRAGVSFGDEHFAETSYYFEGGLRKVRPYYFDFRTYCKGRWVGHSLLHVFSTEFRAQPLAYYEAAVRAGRLHLNEEPVQDLSIVLKVVC